MRDLTRLGSNGMISGELCTVSQFLERRLGSEWQGLWKV